MLYKTPTIILFAILSASCASKQSSPEFSEYLATNIRSDGSKEFQYTAEIANAGKSKSKNVGGGMRMAGGSSSPTRTSAGVTVGSNTGGGKHRKNSGQNSYQQMNEKFNQQLEKKLSQTGFCREGWMETEREFQPPRMVVKGECNETATESDTDKWGHPLID